MRLLVQYLLFVMQSLLLQYSHQDHLVHSVFLKNPYFDGAMEDEVLNKIKDWDSELSDKIRDKMFVFENLTDMDDRSVQTLLRDVNPELLKLALKGTTEATKEKIYTNMSKRAADLLREDMELQGPVKVVDVERAQRDILSIAKNLAEEGKIALGAKGGDEMI